MSNFEKANALARKWIDSMGGLSNINHIYGDDLSLLIYTLRDAGLLAPDAQVIRTPEELEALDGDACTIDRCGDFDLVKTWLDEDGNLYDGNADYLPAVVFASGAQVRAALEAMELDNGF